MNTRGAGRGSSTPTWGGRVRPFPCSCSPESGEQRRKGEPQNGQECRGRWALAAGAAAQACCPGCLQAGGCSHWLARSPPAPSQPHCQPHCHGPTASPTASLIPHPYVHSAGHPGRDNDLQAVVQLAAPGAAHDGGQVGCRHVLGSVHADACKLGRGGAASGQVPGRSKVQGSFGAGSGQACLAASMWRPARQGWGQPPARSGAGLLVQGRSSTGLLGCGVHAEQG